ncbi:hypothetical protein Tco_1307551 [Tanacetum coccineum]
MEVWRCGGDDEDEGGGDDVDGSVMATVVASRVMAWWCTAGVMAAVDGDDVVSEDDDGEVVMDRNGGFESDDETVPASVHEVGESSTAPFLREDSDGLLPGLMRRDINSLFGRMANLSKRLCGRETAHALVEKKGKPKDEHNGKLILDLGNEVRSSVEQGMGAMELEEARLSNTFLRMQNERVERDLYWTRVRAHEFYQEMIRRGFVFEERPNEAINVPIEEEKSPSSESRESSHDA